MSDLNTVLEKKYGLEKYSANEIQKAIRILKTPIGDRMFELHYAIRKLREEHLGSDAFRCTYKGKDADAYENQRMAALRKLDSMSDEVEMVKLLISEAKEIEEGTYMLSYNEAYKKALKPPFIIEVAKNMMLAGFTLTEICKAIPGSQMGDIYHLGERYLGITLELSEEERKQVEEYDSQDEDDTIDVARLWKERQGIPIYDSEEGCWKLGDKEYFDATEVSKLYTACELKYPYYRNNSVQPECADSFEEVLGILLDNPRDISIEGLEQMYGTQELNLFRKTKEKLLKTMDENLKNNY